MSAPSAPASPGASRVRVASWLTTDVGMVREHNEDSAHVDDGGQFFIVADGMGGHAAGEVASAMAVDAVRAALSGARDRISAFAQRPTEDGRRQLVQLLQDAVLSAHHAVFQRGTRESDKQGMGTTLDVVLLAGPEALVAHVGDSRTYVVRDGKATQVTMDHTVAEVLVIEGKLTAEEAQVSPLRTILVNAIGVAQDVGVEMQHVSLRAGDRVLMCSDGLHDYFLAAEEIGQRLSAPDAGAVLREMVELAKERGGHDNITGIVVEILEVGEPDVVPTEVSPDRTERAALVEGWQDDEVTESLTARDLDALAGGAPLAGAGSAARAAELFERAGATPDAAMRATEPMTAVTLAEIVAEREGGAGIASGAADDDPARADTGPTRAVGGDPAASPTGDDAGTADSASDGSTA